MKNNDLRDEVMINARDEVVIIQENHDGSATATLEGSAIRKWSSFEKAVNMIYRAGFRFY